MKLHEEKKNMITCRLSNTQTTIAETNIDEIVKLDKIACQIGKDLTLINNGIKIGKGIKYVKVNGQIGLQWNSPSSANLIIRVAHNGHSIINGYGNKCNANWPDSAILTNYLIEVKEGDTIDMRFNGIKGSIINSIMTFLTVEAL